MARLSSSCCGRHHWIRCCFFCFLLIARPLAVEKGRHDSEGRSSTAASVAYIVRSRCRTAAIAAVVVAVVRRFVPIFPFGLITYGLKQGMAGRLLQACLQQALRSVPGTAGVVQQELFFRDLVEQ